MTIYIGNLSWDCEQEDLHSLFAEYGAVKKCSLPLDRETGRKRGFGFVDMANEADEQKAIDDLQDVEWMGRNIRVNKAEPPSTTPLISASTARPFASARGQVAGLDLIAACGFVQLQTHWKWSASSGSSTSFQVQTESISVQCSSSLR